MIVHGVARVVGPGHRFFDGFERYARELYGIAIDFAKEQQRGRSGPDFTGFIEPRRIYSQGFANAGASNFGR